MVGGIAFDRSATLWSRVGTKVPSTISTASLAGRRRGRSANLGPRSSTTRSTVDFDIPNSRASCRIVKFVRQYAATSSTRSANDSFHGRPRPWDSAPSRRSAVTNLPKTRVLRPVNGAIHDGSDAVITPDTVEIIAEQDHFRDNL